MVVPSSTSREAPVPRQNINDPKYTRTCINPTCGHQFQQKKPGQLVCGVQCRGWLVAQNRGHSGGLRAKAGLEPRVCTNPACGKTYQPVRAKQTACSLECYRLTPARVRSQQQHEAGRDRAAYYIEYDGRPGVSNRKNELRRGARNRKVALARKGRTVEEYEAQLAAQGGVCALCGRKPKTGVKKDGGRMPALHWDHDHKTRRWRKLLCGSCNLGLGCLQDDPVLLRAAAEYIEEHRLAA
jgi:hypothetical protein